MPSSNAIAALIARVQDAFLDIQGLSMTFEQAQRLFYIDRATCKALFDVLVNSAVVTRKPDGTFIRAMPRGSAVPHAA
jgi:hypothetical protein